MILYTSDTHGRIQKITNAIHKGFVTTEDTIVILGDAGFNYYGNDAGDKRTKSRLNKKGITVFCIHGNHEMRPETVNLPKGHTSQSSHNSILNSKRRLFGISGSRLLLA